MECCQGGALRGRSASAARPLSAVDKASRRAQAAMLFLAGGQKPKGSSPFLPCRWGDAWDSGSVPRPGKRTRAPAQYESSVDGDHGTLRGRLTGDRGATSGSVIQTPGAGRTRHILDLSLEVRSVLRDSENSACNSCCFVLYCSEIHDLLNGHATALRLCNAGIISGYEHVEHMKHASNHATSYTVCKQSIRQQWGCREYREDMGLDSGGRCPST